MRRVLTTTALWLLTLALTALPALGAEPGARGETAQGTGQGVLVGLIMGFIFGAVYVAHAYRGTRFGEAAGHEEQAHDVRSGVGGHETGETQAPG